MANILKNMARALGLVVRLSSLQYSIASPVIPQDCALIGIETITASITSEILLPKSTITSKVFKRGQPPANATSILVEKTASAPSIPAQTTAIRRPTPPTYVFVSTSTSISSREITSMPCENSSTTTHHIQIEKTTYLAQEPEVQLEVIYPCATPIPTLTPTIPYGHWSDSLGNPGGFGNSLYSVNEPYGANVEACCNACWFDIPYCLQSYWFSYEGCVVNQGLVNADGTVGAGVPLTGEGVSESCPQGRVAGLVYLQDTNQDPRSTGNFAGPCGVGYADL